MKNKHVTVIYKDGEGATKRLDGFWHSGNPDGQFKLSDSKDGPPVAIFYKATIV